METTKKIKSLLFSGLAAGILIAGSFAQAQNLSFQDLNEGDFKKAIGDLSSNFTHTSVSGAGALGTIFGFELGIIGGLTQTGELDSLAKKSDPNAGAKEAPHGGIFGALSVPLGLTVDALFLPSLGPDDFRFQVIGLGLKWTLTDTLLSLPVDLAIRGHYSSTELKFKQQVGSDPVESEIKYSGDVMGLQALVSKSFIVVTPYAGIGFVSGSGKMDVTGTTSTIFDTSFSSSNSAKSDKTGMQYLVGAQFDLLLLAAGLEYSSQFGADRFSAKLALSF